MPGMKTTPARAAIRTGEEAINLCVGKNLRTARLQAGLSQQQAGDQLGISFQQIQKYEKVSNRVTAGMLWRLAKLYDKPMEWFFKEPLALNREAAE